MAIVTRDDLLRSDVTVSNRPELMLSSDTDVESRDAGPTKRMLINPEVTAKWMWIGFAVLGIILYGLFELSLCVLWFEERRAH